MWLFFSETLSIPKSELSAPLPEEAQELGLGSLSHTQAVVLTRDSLSYLDLLTGPLEGLFVGTCWRKGHGENYCRHFGATFLLITWDFFIVFSSRNPIFPSRDVAPTSLSKNKINFCHVRANTCPSGQLPPLPRGSDGTGTQGASIPSSDLVSFSDWETPI